MVLAHGRLQRVYRPWLMVEMYEEGEGRWVEHRPSHCPKGHPWPAGSFSERFPDRHAVHLRDPGRLGLAHTGLHSTDSGSHQRRPHPISGCFRCPVLAGEHTKRRHLDGVTLHDAPEFVRADCPYVSGVLDVALSVVVLERRPEDGLKVLPNMTN